jgi:hypothetical protein
MTKSGDRSLSLRPDPAICRRILRLETIDQKMFRRAAIGGGFFFPPRPVLRKIMHHPA